MRATLLLLATAAIASATATRCANNNFDSLIVKTSCGCPKKLSKCLEAVADLARLDQVEQCFTASGCKKEDAAEGAIRFSYGYECTETKASEDQDELRKRQNDSKNESATGKNTKAGKTTNRNADSTADGDSSSQDPETSSEKDPETSETAQPETTETPETTAPSTADATTTEDAKTTSADATTTASTPETTSTPSTSAATAQSQITGSTTSKLECSVTKMITTSVCSISKGKTISCTPTITPSATCAPGVICQKDSKGFDVCMRKDNHLTTSGIAVAIVFVIGIIGAVIAIIVSHYQSRAANRKLEAERAALLGGGAYARKGNGKGRAVDVEQSYQQRNPSEAHIPLISPGGTRSDQAYQHPYNNDYFNAPAVAGGSSSVSPSGGPGGAPKLHPGLGALGQDYR